MFLIAFALLSANVHAGTWANSSFSNCRDITITNPAANYSIFVNLTFNTAQSKFNDVRFYSNSCENGGTQLTYFARSNVSSTWASFDVRSNAAGNISVYYGNTTIESESNVNSTWGGNVIHYWGFDEGQGTQTRDFVNAIGSGYNGTLINSTAASWNTTFRKGIGLNFNGVNQTVNLTKDSNFPTGASARTWEAWVTKHDVDGGLDKFMFRYGSMVIGQAWSPFYFAGSNLFGLWTHTFNPLGNNSMTKDLSYLIDIVYNGSNVLIYENGTLDVSTAVTLNTQLAGYAFIGFPGDEIEDNYWNGTMDEIKIYNSALNSTEIANHYTPIEPTFSFGAQQNQPLGQPIITIYLPQNITYFGNSTINLTYMPTVFNGTQATCFRSLDGAANTSNLINNITNFSANYGSITGTAHNITIICNDTIPTFTTNSIFFYNFMGINVSAFDNSTGNFLTNWLFYANNSSASYANTSRNNPSLFEWSQLTQSITNATVDDNFSSLYYFNNTTTINVNNTMGFQQYLYNLTLKQVNPLSLISTPSWSVLSGTSVNVSCSAPEGTPILAINGINTSNPFVSTVTTGSYNFNCSISEQPSYAPSSASNILNVLASGIGCVDNSTYAYYADISIQANEIALNFTDLVSASIVKSDLTDVQLNTLNASIAKNVTGGYFILINSSNVTRVRLNFGNYPNSNSMVLANRTNSTITSFSYSQLSPYITTYTLINEMTGNLMNPPNANVTSMTLFCQSGSSMFNVTNTTTQFTVATNSQMNQSEYTIQYAITELYYRDLLHTNPIENRNFYLVDAHTAQVVQLLMQLQDNTGLFGNSNFRVKKQIGNSLSTITELPFDAEKKAIIYLVNGQLYQLTVDEGVNSRTIGNIHVDTVNLVKTLVIGNLLVVNTTAGNITWALTWNNKTGVVAFNWDDPNNQTQFAEMWVNNYTSGTNLFYTNTTNSSSLSFVYITPTPNATYSVRLHVKHPVFGLGSFDWTTVIAGISGLPSAILSEISPMIIVFAALIFLIILPMSFGPIHGATAGIFVSIMALILAWFGWLPVSLGLIGFVTMFAIFNKLTERKIEG